MWKGLGQRAKASVPQWERDFSLQPMNAHGLFDEYLEMSMTQQMCHVNFKFESSIIHGLISSVMLKVMTNVLHIIIL